MPVNGSMTKCMAMANCTMKMAKLPMKGTGKIISSLDLGESSTKHLKESMVPSITETLVTLVTNGSFMKEISNTIVNMEEESSAFLMVKSLREIL